MKVKLEGFRTHTDSEYSFSDGKLILISGQSGAGKSTIFQAILWGLYGKLNNITTNNDDTLKCSVTIEINNYFIYRQKKPSILQLTIKGSKKVYLDDEGQAMIEQYFGSLSIWAATSYIEQSSRCELISGSNNNKIDLLNNLSFNGDEPEKYIDKIEEKLKLSKMTHKFMEEAYNKEELKFIEELKIRPTVLEKLLSDQQLIEYETDLESHKNLKPIYEQKRAIQQEKIGKYKLLSNNYEQINKRLISLPIITQEQLDATQNLSDDLKSQITKETKTIDNWKVLKIEKDKRNKFLKEYHSFVESFNKLTSIDNNYVDKDIWITKELEKKRKTNKDTFDKYFSSDGEYNANNISNLNVKYQTELDNCSKIEHLRNYISEIDILLAKNITITNDLEHIELELIKDSEYITDLEGYEQNLITQRTQLPNIKLLSDDISDKTVKYQLNVKKKDELNKVIKDLTNKKSDLVKQFNKKPSEVKVCKVEECLKCPLCEGQLQLNKNKLMIYTLDAQIKIDDENRIREEQLLKDTIKDNIDKIEQEFINTNEEIKQISSSINESLSFLNQLKEQYNQVLTTDKELEKGLQESLQLKYEYNNKCNQSNFIKKERINQLSDNDKQLNVIYRELSITNGNLDSLREAIKSFSSEQKTKLRGYVSVLRVLEYVEEPLFSSKQISDMVEYKKKQIQLEALQKEFEKGLELDKITIDEQNFVTIQNNIKSLVIQLEQNKSQIQKNIEIYTMYHELLKQTELIESQINQIKGEINDDLDDKYQLCLDNISWYSEQIQQHEYVKLMVDKEDVLISKKLEVNRIFNEMNHLEEFKKMAIDVECKQLKETVQNINRLLDDIFLHIFDEPISVKIALYKPLKTGQIKQNINLEIIYKGNKYNVGALSGGECDRISLGIMLALNQVSNSPILLLDETLSSLDGNLREACLKMIRKNSRGIKTVLCINHEDVEGLYDKVIKV